MLEAGEIFTDISSFKKETVVHERPPLTNHKCVLQRFLGSTLYIYAHQMGASFQEYAFTFRDLTFPYEVRLKVRVALGFNLLGRAP